MKRLVSVLEPDYYIPPTGIYRAIERKGMFSVIHIETAYKIDCVIKKPTEFQRHVFRRRTRADFFGREIWLIEKNDLILSKLLWAKDTHSEMQFRDVRNLLKSGFDEAYVKNWSKKLGIGDLFEKCVRELNNE